MRIQKRESVINDILGFEKDLLTKESLEECIKEVTMMIEALDVIWGTDKNRIKDAIRYYLESIPRKYELQMTETGVKKIEIGDNIHINNMNYKPCSLNDKC